MTTTTETRNAAIAYQDARDDVHTDTREHLLELGDEVARDASELCDQFERLQEDLLDTRDERDEYRSELQTAEDNMCPDYDAHGYDELAGLIREAHDAEHTDPWPICRHQTCREAGLRGQR